MRRAGAVGSLVAAGGLLAALMAAPAGAATGPSAAVTAIAAGAAHAHAATMAPIQVGSLTLRPCSVLTGTVGGHVVKVQLPAP